MLQKRGIPPEPVYMNDFSDVIKDIELIDPPLEGGKLYVGQGFQPGSYFEIRQDYVLL